MSDDPSPWMYSPEAEQSVLGALLIDNTAIDRVADLVAAGDFYLGNHRAIYRAAVGLIEKGRSADMVTVNERLALDPDARDCGGLAYLAELAVNTPSAHNVRRYAEIVRERSVLRSLFKATRRIQERIADSRGAEVKVLLDEAQSLVMAIGESRLPGRTDFQTLESLLAGVLEFVDNQHQRFRDGTLGDVTGLPTGFVDLDRLTSGFHPGQLILLAARPAMGKSALSLNIAEYAARSSKKTATFFSMEMTNREQGLRLLAANAGVNVQRLVSGRVNEQEWARVAAVTGKLQGVPMVFNEAGALTVTELRALARRAMRECGGLSLVVIDYLQLMGAEASSEQNRAAELADITRGLKKLAKELSVPVLALSQLNRQVESRPNKRPVMSDLRDSGALEQDADVILFIYRDEVYHKDSEDKGTAEIIIAKQRNGPIDTVRLTFRADSTRFANFARAEEKAAA